MVFAILHVMNNNKFHVVYIDNNVKVEPSPSLVWDVTKNIWRIVGYVFFAIMWIVTILLISGKLIGDDKGKLGMLFVGIPLLASVICFFAGYSSKLVNNYVSVSITQFNAWIGGGFISEAGQDKFVDKVKNGKLFNLFEGRNWIK